ncbi:succinate dehydrogenase [Armatimonas sp.]|uniref:succinate dehydrogenase n=1 Tax=Armatimonas sp. TaxID=1872638 RepID=UPI003750F69E
MATTTIERGQPGSKALFKDTYFLHKLHSLSGVIPIGAFMIFHLVANSYSLRGETEFNTAVKAIGYAPFVVLLEIAVIAIPILFHAIYGLWLVAEMPGPGGNTSHYGYGRNWLYVAQRWTGVLALAYILYHVFDTTAGKYLIELAAGKESHEKGFASISYAAMAWRFARPWYLVIYLIGVGSATFHLGNGVLNFCVRWGITIGKEAQRAAAAVGLLLGVGLGLLGWAIAINFAIKGQPLAQKYDSLQALIDGQVATKEAEAK